MVMILEALQDRSDFVETALEWLLQKRVSGVEH